MEIKKYLGNPKLKRTGMVLNLTEEQVTEFIKCSQDPVYFAEKYTKIITLDYGLQTIKLYPFQQDAVKKIAENRRVIIKAGRQVGKTTMVVATLLWYIIFNEDKTVAILANKAKTAREILARLKIAYEELPLWLQQGVKVWNKGDIELENNSRVLADSTASTAIRGFSISFLYLDEFAFVPNNIAEEFFSAVYPTITSGTTSKILISSTPNGMNHFYSMWNESVSGKNGFTAIEASWREVPGRTQEWAEEQRRVLGDDKYLQEMECEFQGSSGTLISGFVLKSLTWRKPEIDANIPGLSIYERPMDGRVYALVADTAHGKGQDYSAMVVVDIASVPYRVVAKYMNNTIAPVVFPSIIQKMGKYYNDAYVLIENNDIGAQILQSLFDDYEYENLLSSMNIKKQLMLTWSVGMKKGERGVRTTRATKRIGCQLLKGLVESYKLKIEDFDIIMQLSTFINKGENFQAEDGSHDDLVMCLVLFAWMTNQKFFADMCNANIRRKLYEQQMLAMEEEMLPSPLPGDASMENMFVSDGTVWSIVSSDEMFKN